LHGFLECGAGAPQAQRPLIGRMATHPVAAVVEVVVVVGEVVVGEVVVVVENVVVGNAVVVGRGGIA
jgi:hypothetical protein